MIVYLFMGMKIGPLKKISCYQYAVYGTPDIDIGVSLCEWIVIWNHALFIVHAYNYYTVSLTMHMSVCECKINAHFFNHVSLEVHSHNNIIILQNKLQVDVGMILNL